MKQLLRNEGPAKWMESPHPPNQTMPSHPLVTGTGTMVTDGFPLGLVWFQDTSLVAVALLCMQEVSFDT